MVNEPIIWKYLGLSYLDIKLKSSIFKRLIFVLIYPLFITVSIIDMFILMLMFLIGITFIIISDIVIFMVMSMFMISPIKYIIYGDKTN